MSKKRQRERRAAVATVAPADRTESASTTAASALLEAPNGPREHTWLLDQVVAMSRMLGSLQAALALGFSFIVVLSIGTMLESWYSARIAQELAYRTWWFAILLALLGVNIFFAAAKKWPWKRHQTGFLITHLGLLTILAGGILNTIGGTDAQMVLLDSNKVAVAQEVNERFGKIPHESGDIYVSDHGVINVTRNRQEQARSFEFSSGSFPWGDASFDAQTPWGLALLDLIAHPWPRSWRRDLGDGAQLEVLAFYPHARREPFSEAKPSEPGFPALKVVLETPFAGSFSSWIALNPTRPNQATENQFPSRTELLGKCPSPLLPEFLKPPDQVGKQGQLVLQQGQQTFRFDVQSSLGQKLPLAQGWQIELTAFVPADRIEAKLTEPIDPVVRFKLYRPDGKAEAWRWSYRAMTDCGPEPQGPRGASPPIDPQAPLIWYHPPDVRAGASELRGLLQFVVDEQNRLHYRSFTEGGGAFRLEASGPVDVGGDAVDVWKAMKWKFQVAELLPRAVEEVRFIPVPARPGLDRKDGTDALAPMISCRLTLNKTSKAGRSQTFTRDFQLTEGSTRIVRLPGTLDGVSFTEEFQIEYSYQRTRMDFQLRLQRFEMQVDRGTNKPATYTSFVQLFDRERSIAGENHVITMNQPLNHRGYKVYQSDYKFLLYDDVGRPVYYSGFTVGRDPGLWLKYLGSAMLALGIVCMFYMKAYFFTPRRPAPVPAPARA